MVVLSLSLLFLEECEENCSLLYYCTANEWKVGVVIVAVDG